MPGIDFTIRALDGGFAQTLQKMASQLSGLKPNLGNLTSESGRFTRGLKQGLEGIEPNLKSTSSAIRRFSDNLRTSTRGLASVQDVMLSAATLKAPIASITQALVGGAAAQETALAQITKVLPSAIKDLDPQSVELRGLVTEVSQGSGINFEDVASGIEEAFKGNVVRSLEEAREFALLAADAMVAFDISGAAAGEQLGTLSRMFGLSGGELRGAADVINTIGNTMGTTAAKTLSGLAGWSSVALQMGLSAEQAALMTATFAEATGKDSGETATNLKRFGVNLQLEDKVAAPLRELNYGDTDEAAWDAFQALREEKGGFGAIQDLLGRLGQEDEEQAKRLKDLFGLYGANIGSLVTPENLERLQEMGSNLGLGDADADLKSVADEAKEMGETYAKAMGRLDVSWKNVSATLGTAILPALTNLLDTVSPLIVSFQQFAAENEGLVGVLLTIGGILAGTLVLGLTISTFATSLTTLGFVISPLVGLLKLLSLGILGSVGKVLGVLKLLTVGMVSAIAVPALLIIGLAALAYYWDDISAGIEGVVGWFGEFLGFGEGTVGVISSLVKGFGLLAVGFGALWVLGALTPIVTAFGIALAFLSANPIGAVIVAVALLAAGIYALYENWGVVTQAVEDAVAAIGQAATDIGEWMGTIGGVGDVMNLAWEGYWGALKGIFDGIMQFVQSLGDIVSGKWIGKLFGWEEDEAPVIEVPRPPDVSGLSADAGIVAEGQDAAAAGSTTTGGDVIVNIGTVVAPSPEEVPEAIERSYRGSHVDTWDEDNQARKAAEDEAYERRQTERRATVQARRAESEAAYQASRSN